jgi:ADP-ribose pyrophosphatase YjhB (NUDIX family)
MVEIHTLAKVFLEDAKGNILLIRRSKTAPRRPLQWDLPGGFVDDGERVMETCLRELKEETGVEVISAKEVTAVTREREDRTFTIHFYLAQIDDPKVVLSYEHDKYMWVGKEDFVINDYYEPHVAAFREVYGL